MSAIFRKTHSPRMGNTTSEPAQGPIYLKSLQPSTVRRETTDHDPDITSRPEDVSLSVGMSHDFKVAYQAFNGPVEITVEKNNGTDLLSFETISRCAEIILQIDRAQKQHDGTYKIKIKDESRSTRRSANPAQASWKVKVM
ncbi:uncharacterized protein LOC110977925 [Acanthaster planci]|uniref:Uncharacterized protein LOC110977925 n=1 Tax=Acanthaster planci TaxID=133434 RepID=A0A8B7Y4N5_ACAPL|nr:uncharacterized protein LOC110977925 [Acanthaster planci]